MRFARIDSHESFAIQNPYCYSASGRFARITPLSTGILEAEDAQFMVCTSWFGPSQIHGLCAILALNSRSLRLFQAPLDTCLDSPFCAACSIHGLPFTVCAPSKIHATSWTRQRRWAANARLLRNVAILGSAKTDPVRFKWGFAEGLLKVQIAFFEAYKRPIPKRRSLLAKRPFL